ncbi:MAG: hypothetical protein AseanaTS_28200 [Candidatus Pelagadaptatus aseana]|uniref:two-partner secretion domain-containing protein n=1 Tax=Candidatus Pelagadaptatus aseana TaxID=3120508 RepID=UPI0039B31146
MAFCVSAHLALPVNIRADVVVDSSAPIVNRAVIRQAQNGVPVIDIAAPSIGGVSHNKYSSFSVESQGLILNNSKVIADTQLGGQIHGNDRLSTTAKIILNEVTSNQTSQLHGLLEVAGQSADVILANPNGISCRGCGFINTPRATLTTGTPGFLDGDLDSFTVNGGAIAIEGLNASTIDRLDLLARAITVNESLHAQQLNLVTGLNQVDYTNLSISPLGDSNADRPEFALDVASLGGMYADQITLVGTESGLGVNMQGELASDTGDIILQADGSLKINKLVSGRNLIAKAGQGDDIDVYGSVYADGEAGFTTATGTLINRGSLIADSDMDIEVSRLLNQGMLGSGGHLRVVADQTIENSGVFNQSEALLFAAGDMNLHAQTVINRQSRILGLKDIVVAADETGTAAQSFHNISASIESYNDLHLTANEFLNARDGLYQMDNSDYCPEGFLCGYTVDAAQWYGMPVDTTGEDLWLLPQAIGYVEWYWNYGSSWDNPDEVMSETYQSLLDSFLPCTRDSSVYVGRNFNALTGDFRNEGSLISVGHSLSVNTTRFVNRSTAAFVPDRGDWQLESQHWLQDLDYELFYGDFMAALIFNEGFMSAGDQLLVNATESISNGFEEQGYAEDIAIPDLPLPESPAGAYIADDLTLRPDHPFTPWLELPAGADFEQVPLDIDLPLPDQAGGLFSYTDPALQTANTLISSRASVAKYVNALGSDHLLELIGLDPDTTIKRLGDGFYESRLIARTIAEATGHRFLNRQFRSDAEQYQHLMANAARAQKDLQLSVGVALTPEQINNLTQDMVWLEAQEVNGEKVLVPTLYLAQARLDHGGSSLHAEQIELNSGGSIHNTSDIFADNRLSLSAEKAIHNLGATLEAQDLAIMATQDDVVLQNLGATKSRIIAHQNLLISTGKEMALLGSDIHSGGHARIQAGRDLQIASMLDKPDYSSQYHWDQTAGVVSKTIKRDKHLNAQINIAADASIASGRDLVMSGSEIHIQGNGVLNAGRDVTLETVTNSITTETRERYLNDYQRSEGGQIVQVEKPGSDSRMRERLDKVTLVTEHTQQGSTLNIKGEMRLAAGDDMDLKGSQIMVGGNSLTRLGGTLSLSAERETQTAVSQSRERFWRNISQAAGDYSTRYTESSVDSSSSLTGQQSSVFTTLGNAVIDAGGSIENTQISQIRGADTLLLAGRDITNRQNSRIEGANLTMSAGQNIDNSGGSLIHGRNIALMAGDDIRNQRDINQTILRRGDFISTDTSSASEIKATEELLLQAGRQIENSGSVVSAGGSAQLVAGDNIAVSAVADRERRADNKNNVSDTTRHLRATVNAHDQLGMHASGDINIFGSDVVAGNDLSLLAGNNINIVSATDRLYRYIHDEDKDAFGGKSETTEIYQTTNVASNITAGGGLSVAAQEQNLKIKGSRLGAGKDIYLAAGGELAIEAAKEIYDYRHEESTHGVSKAVSLAFSGSSNSSTEMYRENYTGANAKSAGDTAVISKGDIRVSASRIEAGMDIKLNSQQGRVALLSEKDIDSYSHHQNKSGAIKQTIKGDGYYRETVKHTELIAGGSLDVDAAKGVSVDFQQQSGESLQQSLARLGQSSPELQWMQQLAERDDVDWQAVQEVHDSWEYEHSGISQSGALIIAIAVTAATAGSGAGFLQSLGVEGASKTAVASVNAAINSLSTQAATSLINNNGDIGAVFDDLISSDSIKSVLVSTLSAGVGLSDKGSKAYSAKDVAVMATSMIDKELGFLLSFGLDNWNDPAEAMAQNFVGETMQYAVRQEVAKQAEHMGLTSEELNLILMVNSFVGRKVAGTTYDSEKNSVEGFLSRRHGLLGRWGNEIGVLWDVNDSILNAQGYLDAVAQQVVADGFKEALVGHSLGAWRVNNIARRGYVNHAITLALPIFDFPVAGTESYCASGDAICGGSIMSSVRPDVFVVDSPSSWRVLSDNHMISTVPSYKLVWDSFRGE